MTPSPLWRRKWYRKTQLSIINKQSSINKLKIENRELIVGEANMIKKGDKVKMLSGKDRNKSGKVVSVLKNADSGRVIVEGLNKVKKNQRPKKQGQKGQIIELERPVHISTVQLICPSCGQPTRTGHRVEGQNKVRVCKKCQAII